MAREGLQGDDRAWNFDFRHPGTSAKVLSRDRDECWFERHVDHLFLRSAVVYTSAALGGASRPKAAPPPVKSTIENLKRA